MSWPKQAHDRLQRSNFSPKRPKQPKQPEQHETDRAEPENEAILPQDRPKTAQDRPRPPQDSPKTAQDSPKIAPRTPKTVPRAVLQFEVDFLTDLGANLTPQRRPKSDQNGTQNRAKSKTNFDIEKEALQDHLGAVLGRSWVIFGRPLGSFLLIFHWFLKLFVKVHFFQKMSLQEPSWTELGPIWVDFGLPNGSNMGPKTHPKSIKKHDKC